MNDFLRAMNEPMNGGVHHEPMNGGAHNEPMNPSALFEPMMRPTAQSSGSLLHQALVMSTAALRSVGERALPPQPRARSTTTERLARWEPWVRVTMAQQTLISGLRYGSGRLWLAEQAAGDPPLLTLRRPKPGTLDLQVQKVIHLADQRLDRLPEILVQVNGFWPFWTSVTNIDPVTAPRTFELLEAAVSLSPAIGMRFKHDLACQRPNERSPLVRPAIAVPGHASHPSGHATAAFLWVGVARALMDLAPGSVVWDQLEILAQRIADNRVVAGVHYPIDGDAGRLLGGILAEYVVAMATRGPMNRAHRSFDPDTGKVPEVAPDRHRASACDFLQAMWDNAVNELIALGIR